MDEKILDIINQAEKADRDIHKGPIKIGNRFYEFEEKKFFDDKLSVYIPKDFEDMPMAARKLKYPSENRPEIIKSSEDGSTAITLNIIDSPLDEEHVKELTDGMKAVIRKLNPTYVFYDEGILKVDSKNIGYFEFKSIAIDDSLYNLMLFLEFEGKTLMGTFSCLYKDYEDWRDIAYQMVNSIRVVKEQQE